MKRWICLMLTAALLLPCLASAAGASEEPVFRAAGTTPLSGKFFTGFWGGSSADLDVRMLIHGYNLIRWNGDRRRYEPNPTVVSALEFMDDAAGNRVYYVCLYSDLFYSDGTKITAYDYAFSFLMRFSPLMAQLGAALPKQYQLMGSEAYAGGEAEVLTGLRVIDERMLHLTIRKEALPFFDEYGLLDCFPYPIHVIAPGCRVEDDGQGAFITGRWTAETLNKTVLDPEKGYLSHPDVSSGPYVLSSYRDGRASFTVNAYYKGDEKGKKPAIRHLEYFSMASDGAADLLRSGAIQLAVRLSRADEIRKCLDLANDGSFASSHSPRSGAAIISFHCEKPALSSAAVRQAIARCIDRDKLTVNAVGSYGMRADVYGGAGQWMFQTAAGMMDPPVKKPADSSPEGQAQYEALTDEWKQLNLSGIAQYPFGTEAAVKLLTDDGWTLNRQGQPFDAERDDVRCKLQDDGSLTELELTLCCPEGSRITDDIQACAVAPLAKAGIVLKVETADFSSLLDMYECRAERTADMLFLGTDFDAVFDLSADFEPDGSGSAIWRQHQLKDQDLYQLALNLRGTQPGDMLAYCKNWIRFQERFSQVLPAIPIYTNEYYDIYTASLTNYDAGGFLTWSQAIATADWTPSDR